MRRRMTWAIATTIGLALAAFGILPMERPAVASGGRDLSFRGHGYGLLYVNDVDHPTDLYLLARLTGAGLLSGTFQGHARIPEDIQAGPDGTTLVTVEETITTADGSTWTERGPHVQGPDFVGYPFQPDPLQQLGGVRQILGGTGALAGLSGTVVVGGRIVAESDVPPADRVPPLDGMQQVPGSPGVEFELTGSVALP
jgi:hypothetical protein